MTEPTYIDKISTALELDEMSPEEQEGIMVELSNLIFQGTMIKVMETMSEADKEGLFALEDGGASEEEVTEYINKHIPNSDALVQETISELVDDIVAVTAN